jgi:hypothetical protein
MAESGVWVVSAQVDFLKNSREAIRYEFFTIVSVDE